MININCYRDLKPAKKKLVPNSRVSGDWCYVWPGAQAVGQPWILYDASMGFPGRKSIVRVAYKSFFSGPDQITKEDI